MSYNLDSKIPQNLVLLSLESSEVKLTNQVPFALGLEPCTGTHACVTNIPAIQ